MRLVVAAALFVSAVPDTRAESTPAGYQEYIVLGRDGQVFEFNAAVAAAEGLPLTVTQAISVVTLTATADGQTVAYDHWEDGYESDPFSPSQATTQVFTMSRGQVLSLRSDGSGAGINARIPLPRVPTDVRYDGGDRVLTSGGPVNLAHNMWPQNGTTIGDAWEIFPRQAFAGLMYYRIPVGADSYTAHGGDTGTFAPFKHIALQIAAYDDDTEVLVDNGGDQVYLVLNRGETWSSRGSIDEDAAPSLAIIEGTSISATSEIQVGMLTGSDGTYQTRFFDNIPVSAYGRDYVVPVRGYGTATTNIYIFNPGTAPISGRMYDTAHTAGVPFTLQPDSATSWIDVVGAVLATNSAARLTADGLFWGVVAYDYTRTTNDWGFSLIPTRLLTEEYFVSWSPAHDTTVTGPAGNPVWVTPVANGTVIQVDLNADGTFDNWDSDGNGTADMATTTLNALQAVRIYDPTDNDNTGTRIVASGPIAVSYGQDAATAGAGAGYLDLGYTVLPLVQGFLDPVLTIDAAPSATSVPAAGGTRTVTLRIRAGDYDGITGVDGWIEMQNQVQYAAGSALVTLPPQAPAALEPTDTVAGAIRTLRWDLDADLDADGLLDVDDECPNEREVFNGIEDDDGCPDEGAALVEVEDTQIRLLQKVQFKTDSDQITGQQSFEILEAVLSVLKSRRSIQVRIEGHTDSRGGREHNLDLSRRRAASVMRWLVEHGIDADRVTSEGYGQEQPIADNRRVEFHITKQ
jgi:outer membrane protein OmpA-like peptidoglycan-associated protein